jgi:hypothetical protein
MEQVKVVVLGTGKMGLGVIKLLLQKEGVDLAGVYAKRKEREGLDVGDVLGLDEKLDALAKTHNVTVLGTGINPGFVLDLLIIALTGLCFRVDRVKGTRINDLSPYGYNVLKTQGVNLLPEDFENGVKDGSVVGHFGFPESISMIARALGWEIDRIEQKRTPIVSKVESWATFVH